MNGRSFMDGLSLKEEGREGERERERGRRRKREGGRNRKEERGQRKRGNEREEREREEERGRERRTLDRNGTPPLCPPMVGSVGLGGTGDQDEWDVIHLDGWEWMEGHSWTDAH